MKEQRIIVIVFLLTLIFTLNMFSQPEVTEAGDVWFVPEQITVQNGDNFRTEIHINTGTQRLAAYGINVAYDENLISVNQSIGNTGVEAGADDFFFAVNNNIPGLLMLAGFEIYGVDSNEDLSLVVINWTAKNPGTANFQIEVRLIIDDEFNEIIGPSDNSQTSNELMVTIIENIEPDLTDDKKAGDVWFVPEQITVQNGTIFQTEIHLNTGTQKLAAYGIDITYDADLLSVDQSIGLNGVEAGADGFVVSVNAKKTGLIRIAGFEINGVNPSEDLNLVVINWIAKNKGTSKLDIKIRDLVDLSYSNIPDPSGKPGTVIIE
jgi:hypothetical protein